ncbi:hypothetical protein OLMES_4015 [Oleiphilus messinensis]|uniref:Uncharacterized protein n=1 Tax=Oleiphilus messinensis TaxID=141451 RepID=A0A1Y0IF84_9GAMM|nr:hypothetical protein OLMES_4015 [Oleiphilus messinensis]
MPKLNITKITCDIAPFTIIYIPKLRANGIRNFKTTEKYFILKANKLLNKSNNKLSHLRKINKPTGYKNR